MILGPSLAAAARAALRGAPVAEAAPDKRTLERAAAGDPDARARVREMAHTSAVSALAGRALAREAASVVLADGSALTLDEAERALCAKEERRPHRPLRAALDAALDPFRHFHDDEIEAVAPALSAFLDGTQALAAAACEALAAVAGGPLDDDLALARALDLPRECLSAELALDLVRAVREASGFAVRRVVVPRALAGVVFLDDGAAFGVAPGPPRFDRFSRNARGGLSAVAASAKRSPAVGEALALGGLSRAVLVRAGVPRSESEHAARVAALVALLRARALAATAGHPWEEAFARAVPLGVRPTAALRELLVDGERFTLGEAAEAAVAAAPFALALRDALDEDFATRPAALREEVSPSVEPAIAWGRWLEPFF